MAVGIVPQVSQPSHPSSFNNRSPVKLDEFNDLVVALKEALGPSSGLDSSDVDLNTLMRHMRVYDANERGWVPYAMADPELAYTRNLVDEGNGKSNLVSLELPTGLRDLRDYILALCQRAAMTDLAASCHSLCLYGHLAWVAPSTTTATPTAS